jgi:elongation factor 1-gamma
LAREGNDKGLYGTNNYEASKIDAWMDLIADFVGAKIFDLYGFVYPLWQHPYNKEKFDDAVEVSKKMWALIDKQLSKHKYLINDRVTLADIILAGYYKNPLKYSLGKDFRSQFPKVEAYFAGLYNLKEFKNAIGEIKFVEKLEL